MEPETVAPSLVTRDHWSIRRQAEALLGGLDLPHQRRGASGGNRLEPGRLAYVLSMMSPELETYYFTSYAGCYGDWAGLWTRVHVTLGAVPGTPALQSHNGVIVSQGANQAELNLYGQGQPWKHGVHHLLPDQHP